MTRDEILSMEPGRELDALVAEKVMRFRCVVDKENGNVSWIAYGVYGETHTPPMAWKKWNYKVPPYSTDIAAAWEVLEKFFWVQVTANPPHIWKATVITSPANGSVTATAKGFTAPEAICKAALLAVMEG